MSDRWPTLDVASWTLAGIEQQGLHEHEWYRSSAEPRTWLFKPARQERHRAFGEDVAEKIACEMARLVGVPAARVELAIREAERGVLVEDARPPDWELQHGQVLMGEAVEDYDPNDREHRGHNPEAIRTALQRFGPPPGGALPNDFSAFDAFAGYLIFDALIAHVDRHDRNWAVLVPPPGEESAESLCASFDHAASLGFTLSAADCAEHLRAGTVGYWASRGRASRFEHHRGTPWLSLVELAANATGLCRHRVRRHWQGQLLSVDRETLVHVLSDAPLPSDVAGEFIVELILRNRRRLLDVLS